MSSELPDHASEADHRALDIDRVGIKDLRYPIQVLDRAGGMQHTVANVNLYVGLPHHFKGTHMSRFVEILNAVRGEITFRNIPEILAQVQRRLEADDAYLELEFPYFMEKHAPVSGVASLMEYTAWFHASRHGDRTELLLGVAVPVKSLCPCSKAVSDYGAHNQRSIVRVEVRSQDFLWLEDIIEAVEKSASAPLFALLKRSDEKWVTEHAYDNPKFVEDLVRDVVIAVRDLPGGVTDVKVQAENQESIHNHAAYGEIDWRRDLPAPDRAARTPAAQGDTPLHFGAWLRDQRKVRKLSQRALAELLDVSPSYLSRVESGDKPMSTDAVDRLASAWGLDPVNLHIRAGRLPEDLVARISAHPEALRAWAASL